MANEKTTRLVHDTENMTPKPDAEKKLTDRGATSSIRSNPAAPSRTTLRGANHGHCCPAEIFAYRAGCCWPDFYSWRLPADDELLAVWLALVAQSNRIRTNDSGHLRHAGLFSAVRLAQSAAAPHADLVHGVVQPGPRRNHGRAGHQHADGTRPPLRRHSGAGAGRNCVGGFDAARPRRRNPVVAAHPENSAANKNRQVVSADAFPSAPRNLPFFPVFSPMSKICDVQN